MALLVYVAAAQEVKKKPNYQFGGYFQTGWFLSHDTETSNGFRAKRLRPSVAGEVTENLSFLAQAEAMSCVVKNERNQQTVQILDVYATYKFTDAFQVRAGQYYLPFGYETNDLSPLTLETIDFSDVCERIVCRNGIGFDHIDYARDLGVMVPGNLLPAQAGDYHHLTYNLSITNGQIPSACDDNNAKDYIASLVIRPVQRLNIMATYCYGEYTGLQDVIATRYKPMQRAMIGAWYQGENGLTLRSEYGIMNSTQFGTTLVNEHGVYLLASYKRGEWNPFARLDYFRNTVDKSDYESNYNRVVFGVNYTPLKYLRIQMNCLLSTYSGDAKATLGKSTSEKFQVVAELNI